MAGEKRSAQKPAGEKPAKRARPAVAAPVDDDVGDEPEAAPNNDQEGSGEDNEEEVETPSKPKKQVKVQKPAGKSPAKDDTPSRSNKGRIVSKSQAKLGPEALQTDPGEYRNMCLRCAKELSTWPELRCWHAGGTKSLKCEDCRIKGKTCLPVSSPVDLQSLADCSRSPLSS